MKDPASPGSNRRETSSVYPLAIVALSVAAIVSTFAISLYSEDPRIEARSFSGILVAYLIACGVLYRLCRKDVRVRSQQGENDIEEQLRILDDANTFFAGSLNTSDTFRLLISRIKE